jgi:branched-chain amino acid transport system substrate-binding protein
MIAGLYSASLTRWIQTMSGNNLFTRQILWKQSLWMRTFSAILLLAALFSVALWWSPKGPETIRVGIGIDMPLMVGAAVNPSDWNTAELFVSENPGTHLQPSPFFVHPLPEHAAPDLEAAIASGVRFFILTHDSKTAIASREVFSDARALGILVGATSIELSGLDDGLLRIIPDLRQEQLAMARHLRDLPGQRLLVLQDLGNTAYTDPAFAVLAEALAEDGRWEITRHRLPIASFTPSELSGIMQDEYDALYVLAGAFLPPIGNIAQLFHHLHPEAPILLTPWARSAAVLEHSGVAIDRMRLLSFFPPRANDSPTSDFMRRFALRFGHEPPSMSISTHIGLELLHQAFTAGHRTPDSVKQYLLSRGRWETSLGQIQFDGFGDIQMDYFLITNLREDLR